MALPLYLKAAAVVAVLGVISSAVFLIYEKGRNDEDLHTYIENSEAGVRAGTASMSWRACRDIGGVYQFATGECRRAEVVSGHDDTGGEGGHGSGPR